MKKKLCLLLALCLALTCICFTAHGESAVRRMTYEELPAAHRNLFNTEMESALANAASRAPGSAMLLAAFRGENSGYSATKSVNGLTASYTVSASMVEVGQQVKFTLNFTCQTPPMLYTVGGLVMDKNFNKVGNLGRENGESIQVDDTVYSYSFNYRPDREGFLNLVIVVSDEEGNMLGLTTPTVQVYEGDIPLFDSIGSDKDVGTDVNNSLALRLALDDTSTKLGEWINASATFTTAKDPVTYTAAWTLLDAEGHVLDEKETTGQAKAQSAIATVTFPYQPLRAGEVRFLITATDGDGNQVRINTPDIPVADGFYFEASLDKDVLPLGSSAKGTYRIQGHNCDTTVAFVGWECYDALNPDKMLTSTSGVIDGRAGTAAFAPRIGETIVFFVGATCEHYPDAYPKTDRLTLIGGTQVELMPTAASAQAGHTIGVEYIVDGGLTPLEEVLVNGYSRDRASGKTFHFLNWSSTGEEGTASGTANWGDEVYFVIKVVEADGYASTWTSGTIPLTRSPGDADENGSVDISDALAVLLYASDAQGTINLGNADVNGDNTVDLRDALLIFQQEAGWDVKLNK